MPVSMGSNCLTRVVVDDDLDIEIAQLQSVMQRIQDALRRVPVTQREYIANALLNLAVAQMLKEEGAMHTAGILARLGSVVSEGRKTPQSEHAIDLSRLDG